MHDSGYKLLFSNRTIFRQLIETFVDEPWVKEVDLTRCEPVDKSFVSDEYRQRESDLIYRVALRGEEFYIYVLIEFQSTVDRFMAVRVLNYLTSFYLDYVRAHRGKRKLPPIFPLVLYNGDRRWDAATEIADLIERIDLLGPYHPRFRYYKLAENEFATERLLEIGNIATTLFLAEQDATVETVVAALVELFDREEDKQAVSILVNWFRQMITHGRIDPADQAALATTLRSKEEVATMLRTFTREKQAEYERGRQEGRQEGWQEGQQEGRQEGIYAVAQRMTAAGFALEEIVQATGLAAEVIQALPPLGEADGLDLAAGE